MQNACYLKNNSYLCTIVINKHFKQSKPTTMHTPTPTRQTMELLQEELADILQLLITPPTIPAPNIICKFGTKTPFTGLHATQVAAKKDFLFILTFKSLDALREYLKTKEPNAIFYVYCLSQPTNTRKYFVSTNKFWED